MPEPTQSTDAAENPAEDLPLEIGFGTPPSQGNATVPQRLPRLLVLPLIFLIMFTGAVIGIYIQPPALRAFLRITGLTPGGGTDNPIAVAPPAGDNTHAEGASTIRSVIALGRLVPEGDVVTVAMPYGAGDARVDTIHIRIGQLVERGDTLAILDSAGPLQNAVASAEANLALKKASLDQTRNSIGASLKEARATRSRARATAKASKLNLRRTKDLFDQGVSSQATLDSATARSIESRRDVDKASATLSRYSSEDLDNQADVTVALRGVEAARADLNRAQSDLARSIVTAPVSGTVLDVHVHPGEKPGTRGIADIGNTKRMTAELEVYQSEIAFVAPGQRVELTSDALKESLTGLVSTIGYSVSAQSQLSSDPAANSDARVIDVTVMLDPDASRRAARLVNLEVTARIAVEDEP